MEQDTLADILHVENELREQLDAENDRAAAWLATTLHELQAGHQRDLAALEAATGDGAAAVAHEADEQAQQLIRDAEQAAAGAARLSPEALRAVVRSRLAAILPGGAP